METPTPDFPADPIEDTELDATVTPEVDIVEDVDPLEEEGEETEWEGPCLVQYRESLQEMDPDRNERTLLFHQLPTEYADLVQQWADQHNQDPSFFLYDPCTYLPVRNQDGVLLSLYESGEEGECYPFEVRAWIKA